MLAADLANPGHGHEQVPFLCLCDSNTEARVMYEAGVRYVIQSEALAVQPPCLALTRPPCANARTRSRLEPVAALCVNEGCMHHTARTRRQLTARTHGVFFLCLCCAHRGALFGGRCTTTIRWKKQHSWQTTSDCTKRTCNRSRRTKIERSSRHSWQGWRESLEVRKRRHKRHSIQVKETCYHWEVHERRTGET